ncbi:MAG: TolC family protein [Phycisphaerales bacterium]|nr:TolC family protein [Phycisphaerales bacterium]
MSVVSPPPTRRYPWRASNSILAMVMLVGCQSYEPVPLDIRTYRLSLDSRLVDTEPVSDFAQRLQASGGDVPTRFDPGDGISSAEGEVLALFYNPDLRIARLEAGVALANKETAGLWDDPVFGFDAAEIISPPTPFEWGAMGRLTIPISGRLDVEKARAGAAYESQLRAVVDAEWQVRAELRRRWARWTAAVEHRELLGEIISQLDEISDIADQLAKLGELNRVERRLLRIELADRQVQSSQASVNVIEAERALLEVLGLPPTAASMLLPDFPGTDLPEVDDVTARLIECNTELAVHFADYQVAEETLRLEITKQFPDIVIGSGYGTQFNDHRVMFGVSIPVPILNANKAPIAEATAQREVVRAQAETAFARIWRELSAANASLALKQAQHAEYQDEVVPLLTEQNTDLARIAELGEVDLFVLLETLTRTYQTKRRLIDLQVEQLDAAITVHRILGPARPERPAPVNGTPGADNPPRESDDALVAGDRK